MNQTITYPLWGIVTGATGGIGPEFCRRLAERGYNLVLVSDREKELVALASALRADFKTDMLVLSLDLSQEDSPRRVMAWLEENWIEPDVCINNAGIFSFMPMTETTVKRRDLFIQLHVRAVTELSVMMAGVMVKRGKGYILNMSSMSCWTPMPGIAMYAATKAYIRVFSRALHYELKDSGVHVTVACPGGIATDLFGLPENLRNLAVKIGAIDTPARFTNNAVKAMFRGKAQYINGFLNRLAIFFVGISPGWVRMLVKRKMLDKGIRR